MTIVLFFLILFAVIAIGTPVATVFGGMAVPPGTLDASLSYTMEATICSMVSGLDDFTPPAVPFLMLSGIIMVKGGILEKLFNFLAYFTGSRMAGTPCTVITTYMSYGVISGSSPAAVPAVGAMTIPFLIFLGYDGVFSTSIVTVAGDLGVIIPPNTSYIVHPSVSGASPSALSIDGIIPGILISIALMICAYIKCKRSGEDEERPAENCNRIHGMGFWNLFKESSAVLLTPVIIPGSIYGETAFPTEAVAISVVYALAISTFICKTSKISELGNLLVEGCKTYMMTLFVVSAATAFECVLTMLRYPQMINEGILGNIPNRIAVTPVINLTLLIFGMILDNIPNIMILTLIFLPVATTIDTDPVYFDIMMTANLAIGMVTPPTGINLYVASSMTKIPVLKTVRAVISFLISFFTTLLLVIFTPQSNLWLVRM